MRTLGFLLNPRSALKCATGLVLTLVVCLLAIGPVMACNGKGCANTTACVSTTTTTTTTCNCADCNCATGHREGLLARLREQRQERREARHEHRAGCNGCQGGSGCQGGHGCNGCQGGSGCQGCQGGSGCQGGNAGSATRLRGPVGAPGQPEMLPKPATK